MRHILIAVALATFVGCGGGGGSTPPAPQVIDMGLVPVNTPSTATFSVSNSTGAEGTVTDVSAASAFTIDGGQLPLVLANGASSTLDVTFNPPAAGMFEGVLTARLTSANGVRNFTVTCSAEAELPSIALQTLNVAFGDVLPDTTADRTVTVANNSLVTTLALTGGGYPSAAFAFTEAFPIQIAPGATADLTLRYAATGPGSIDGTAQVVSERGPLPLGVTASTGGLEVIDLGNQTFLAGGDTAEMTFDIPADAIAFTVEGVTDSGTVSGLRLLEGPGAREYENETLTGPYIWRQNPGLHLSQVPNTDRNEVQLVAGGGTYRLKLWRVSGSDTDVDVRILVQRRPAGGTDVIGTIDLNVFLADAITPTAATAASDATLGTVLTTVDNILAQQGVRLGDIDYYDINDATYDDVTGAEFGPLLATSSVASEVRLNLFFVRTAIGGGILGVAAMLGGPAINGTTQSGVMSLYTTNNPAFIGLVAAHEIGHFIGLAHTVEQNGQHDDITDTAQCPATGTNGTCTTAGGGYLMHWQAVGGSTITDGQGGVLRGHPLVGPRLVPPPPFTALQSKPQAPFIQVDPTVPQNWCGTCRCGGKHAPAK